MRVLTSDEVMILLSFFNDRQLASLSGLMAGHYGTQIGLRMNQVLEVEKLVSL